MKVIAKERKRRGEKWKVRERTIWPQPPGLKPFIENWVNKLQSLQHKVQMENDILGRALFLPKMIFCSSRVRFSCSRLIFCRSSSILRCSSTIWSCCSAWVSKQCQLIYILLSRNRMVVWMSFKGTVLIYRNLSLLHSQIIKNCVKSV